MLWVETEATGQASLACIMTVECIIVMIQFGFRHCKYLKLHFVQGRLSCRHMSRLQRIIGKPGGDFSDSKKTLQSQRV